MGTAISLLLLLTKGFFREDIFNPTGDFATLFMFSCALFLYYRKKPKSAVNMLFFIPVLVYLYYLASFSNIAPPSSTIYYSLCWFTAGMVVLVYYTNFSHIYLLYTLTGMVTMLYHSHTAGLLDNYLTADQIFIRNPFILFLFAAISLSLIRLSSDLKTDRLKKQKLILEQELTDTFQKVKQPLAQVRAYRDPEGNIFKLEIEKINHAFESGFKLTYPEAKNQELNYLFNFVFRGDINWNDLIIFHPRQEFEFYSVSHDRWFNFHVLWFGPTRCLCIFYDITRYKNEISTLQMTKARYLALLEAIPDIFFVIDRDGTYQEVVFKGQESMYLETSEVIGNTIFQVGFSEMMAGKVYECIQKAIDNDSIEAIEYSMETKNATLLFEMRLARLDGNSVISIARDITRRKKAEFELENARQKAEDAVALKSRFLANLSHDIRTPMNIIVGLTKLMAEQGVSEQEKEEYIQNVQLQGNILLQMIENTIHLSKIETDTLEIHFAFTNIHTLLQELYNHFYVLLPDNKDLRLILETSICHSEVGFETDSFLLKEVLFKLLDNAIKFTNKGYVRFGYTVGTGSSVEFFVEDTGQGIPEEEKENIFLRFYVIENDRLAQKSGPGLGLPIAQHFTALLGGELSCDSLPGKGSRFWFRLPLKNQKGFLKIV